MVIDLYTTKKSASNQVSPKGHPLSSKDMSVTLQACLTYLTDNLGDLWDSDPILKKKNISEKDKGAVHNTLMTTRFHPIGSDHICMIFLAFGVPGGKHMGVYMRLAHILQRELFFCPTQFGLNKVPTHIDLTMDRLVDHTFYRLYTHVGLQQRAPLSLMSTSIMNLTTEDFGVITKMVPHYKTLFHCAGVHYHEMKI